jgi:hypothetical protein
MPIRHKFENKPTDAANIHWPKEFGTSNAILTKTPYKPEVIIIGSFNHGWPWNPADFFYGRNMYMWTVMSNLFVHNANVLIDRRNPPNNNTPTLNQIFEICTKGKLCFADVILGSNSITPAIVNNNTNTVILNGSNWDSYKDSLLNRFGRAGYLDTNVANIISFIQNTPTIKNIYFTFSSGGNWLINLRNVIVNAFPNLQAGSIYTPTGMSLENIQGYPCRPWSLAHHWVWNNANHPIAPLNNANFIHLDHQWLIRNGVNPNNF